MRAVITDVPKLPSVSSSHDCGSLSRVVMVRKTDHRMINHKKPEAVNIDDKFKKIILKKKNQISLFEIFSL